MQTSEKDKGGPPTIHLRIQTPRGLWSDTEPKDATKRPVYPISTKIETVIADARSVFGFVEEDNKYQLLLGKVSLEPQRPLASYHLENGSLLVLSVQGGNAYQRVEPALSLEAIRGELVEAARFAASAGLDLDLSGLSEQNLKFSVRFHDRIGRQYFAEFRCEDYPLLPPYIEFTDNLRSAAGESRLYPNVFHNKPCICMRYSRKAYTEHGGPHGDWRMIDWHLPTPGGGAIDSLAMIISDLHSKILNSTGALA